MQKLLFFFMGCFVGAIFAFIALRQEFSHGQTSSTLPRVPVCDSLPERESDNSVSILTSRITSHPGIVCARLFNGTQETLSYEPRSLRLERRWLGIIWSSALRLRGFLPGDPRIAVQLPLFMLRPGERQDKYVASLYGPTPPGKYRVRLRYRVPPEGKELTVYSDVFVLP